MRTIQIEDHIYEYLRQKQTSFSESESQVLERELGLIPATAGSAGVQQARRPAPQLNVQALRDEFQRKMEKWDDRHKTLWNFVRGPQYQSERSAVRRFLSVLAFLHRENHEKFGSVLGISGRTRKYFAKSEADLKQSGTSVNPKLIPGSDYWVVTNNSSWSKTVILLDVFKLLGYDGSPPVVAAIEVKPKKSSSTTPELPTSDQ